MCSCAGCPYAPGTAGSTPARACACAKRQIRPGNGWMRLCRRTPRTAAAGFQATGGQATEERHGQGSSAGRCGIGETLAERRLRIGRPAHVPRFSLEPGHPQVAWFMGYDQTRRNRKIQSASGNAHAIRQDYMQRSKGCACVRVPSQLTHRHVPRGRESRSRSENQTETGVRTWTECVPMSQGAIIRV
jgi:hypothetical protein